MVKSRTLVINTLALALGMFLLAYASVPLYRLFCQVTGYGGTTQRAQASELPTQVFDRKISVRFNADTDPKLPWSFHPGEHDRTVKVGEHGLTYYVAENRTAKPITGMATYNVVPHEAGQYFVKISCFCFEEQTLAANQKVDMPVSFFIDPAIMNDPALKDVNTITLSYTFFMNKE
jgi:cytochrome c oxidase assembly protein subunit 11